MDPSSHSVSYTALVISNVIVLVIVGVAFGVWSSYVKTGGFPENGPDITATPDVPVLVPPVAPLGDEQRASIQATLESQWALQRAYEGAVVSKTVRDMTVEIQVPDADRLRELLEDGSIAFTPQDTYVSREVIVPLNAAVSFPFKSPDAFVVGESVVVALSASFSVDGTNTVTHVYQRIPGLTPSVN